MAQEKKFRDIDFTSLLVMLWNHRKRLILNCVYGGILAIIVAYSIPKEYTSTVVLAPELSGSSGLSGGLGSLASLAGVDLNLSGEDALYPELYPQIVSSTPFLSELMSMRVSGKYRKEPVDVLLYDYLRNYQREPWWSRILGTPGRIKARLQSNPADTIVPSPTIDSRKLTRRQQLAMKSLDKKIGVNVDKGTNVITLNVTMQDPEIAAQVVQAVSDNLQKYIVDYRSAKARKDLEYIGQLYGEAKQNYYDAQQAYAKYTDQHQGLVKMQYQVEQERLSNEMNLAYDVYNQLASQHEMAKAKVQEKTPVCVLMQPPVVPFKASHPKKMMMGLLYVFLAFFGTAAWLLIKEGVLKE